jgi:hypothetical protein
LADAQAFTWLNKQGVRSSDGFDAQFTGRYEFTYREGDHVLKLEGEDLFGNLEGRSFAFGFYDSWQTARWQPPHDEDEITTADRLRIRSNIMEAIEFMDGRAKFR